MSHSMDVTDAGIKVLCNPEISLEEEEVRSKQQCDCATGSKQFAAKRVRKISAPAGCMVWLPRMIVKGIRRHSVVNQQLNRTAVQQMSISEEEDSNRLWPEEELPSDIKSSQPPSSCITSLRRLDVHGTQVTQVGLRSILSAASPDIILLS